MNLSSLLVAVMIVSLAACSEKETERSPLEKWAADVATATSVGDTGTCHLDDWTGQLFVLTSDATVYARGYSDERFCMLRVGMTKADVLERLGEPLSEVWEFRSFLENTNYELVAFESGHVSYAWPNANVRRPMTGPEVIHIKGMPREVTLNYSSRNEDTHYRQRSVHLVGDRVVRITAGIYVD